MVQAPEGILEDDDDGCVLDPRPREVCSPRDTDAAMCGEGGDADLSRGSRHPAFSRAAGAVQALVMAEAEVEELVRMPADERALVAPGPVPQLPREEAGAGAASSKLYVSIASLGGSSSKRQNLG